jgi:hypothetical protein
MHQRRGAALLPSVLAAALSVAATACHRQDHNHKPPPSLRSSAHVEAAPRSGASVSWLARAIENVDIATPTFGLRDSAGVPMDALKVVEYPRGYLGVYHSSTPQSFAVRVATSTDLRTWTYRTQLDANASQPTLAVLSDSGYVLAVEADNGGRAGPGRRWLRFRHYTDWQELLSARPDRTFNAPHTLTAAARGAEGTPNIYSATIERNIDHSDIEVGFHFLTRGVDREARGVLTNFSSWATRHDNGLDRALAAIGMDGKHGDRDSVEIGARLFTIVESQDDSDGVWKVQLLDPAAATTRRLAINTAGGSTSFANPTLTIVTLPTGRKRLVVTLFIPRTGSAPGEVGELLYYRDLPPGWAGMRSPITPGQRA